jgi:hypothetical protein
MGPRSEGLGASSPLALLEFPGRARRAGRGALEKEEEEEEEKKSESINSTSSTFLEIFLARERDVEREKKRFFFFRCYRFLSRSSQRRLLSLPPWLGRAHEGIRDPASDGEAS